MNCAKDTTENSIVRHEAVSAYSSIYNDKDILYFFNKGSSLLMMSKKL
jgi:hypothetical protein